MEYDTGLMVEVSYLYYKCGLKQESVARKLNISKYKVSRVIKSALRLGVVQIKIINPAVDTIRIEEDLKEDYNSKGCLIGINS